MSKLDRKSAGRDDSDRSPQLAMFGIVLIAIIARSIGIHSTSPSIDETYELARVGDSISKLILDADGQPPLYPLLLKLFVGCFGITSARWLGGLLGVLNLLVMWPAARIVGSTKTALWSCLLLAVCPLHIYFCQEARLYPLFCLNVSLVILAFLLLRQRPSPTNWILWTIACLLAIYTHYYSVLPIAVLSCWLLNRSGFWRAHTALVILSLPACYLLLADLQFQENYGATPGFDLPAFCFTYFSVFSGYSLGPSFLELHHMPASLGILHMSLWIVLLGGLIGLLSALYLKVSGSRCPAEIWTWVSLLLCPVVTAGLLGEWFGVGFEPRYMVWVIFPILLQLPLAVASCNPRPAELALVGVLVVSLFARFQYHTEPNYWREQPALAVSLITETAEGATVTAVHHPLAEAIRYWRPSWNVHAIGVDDGRCNHIAKSSPRAGCRSESASRCMRALQDKLAASSHLVTHWPLNEAQGAEIVEQLTRLGWLCEPQCRGHLAVFPITRRPGLDDASTEVESRREFYPVAFTR